MGLLEVPDALGHAGDDAARRLRAQDPFAQVAFGQGPGRHKARGAVRQDPLGPVFVLEGEAAPQFDGVRLKQLQHVLVHDGELLDGVIDADRPLRESQEIAQAGVGHGGDARGAVAGEVNGNTIRFLVVQGGEDSFTGGHNSGCAGRNTMTSAVLFSLAPSDGERGSFIG